MARKIGRKLSPTEIARHEEIRRQVRGEFPPKAKSASPKPLKDSIGVRLRETIKTSLFREAGEGIRTLDFQLGKLTL